jgi:hypothetical protein
LFALYQVARFHHHCRGWTVRHKGSGGRSIEMSGEPAGMPVEFVVKKASS